MVVSIPHRYCKNKPYVARLYWEDGVSIPHRYCKNVVKTTNRGDIMAKFQFLIGTVKTRIPRQKRSTFIWFQFLIGTVKTMGKNCPEKKKGKFQFLIGTVKTLQPMEEI